MKRILIFLLLCILSMALYSAPVSAWDFPVSLDITQISFNYSGSIADTLKKDCGTTIITAPEWRKYYGGSMFKDDRFAYTKGSTPTVKAIFSSPDPDPAESVTIEVVTCSTASDSGFVNYTGWNLNGDTITFPSGPLETEGVFTTQSGTSVKNSVGKNITKFLWRITDVGEFYWPQDLGYSTHKYYTLLGTPSNFVDYYANPVRYGQPWIEVLDLACYWAKDVAYDTNCVGALTDSLYAYTQMKNDRNATHTWGASTLKLRLLLQDISSQDTTLCDCQDYSNFLNVLVYSLGCSSYLFKYKRIWPSDDDANHKIDTKELKPAQWGYSIPTIDWGLHQIVLYNNGTYADAATKYSSSEILVHGDYTWAQYIFLLTNETVKEGEYGNTVVGSGE